MEVKSQQERIKAYRREICERAENIVDIHKNLWADDIAVSRTITGESYLPLSRHAANWPSPFLRARKPSPFSSPDVLLLRFTLHLETLRFHLIGMSFVGSCLRNTNCDPDSVRLKIRWNSLGNVFAEDQVDFAKGFKIRLSDVCHCFAVQRITEMRIQNCNLTACKICRNFCSNKRFTEDQVTVLQRN